jgi:uncharacterized RDD family membrane protein YckC
MLKRFRKGNQRSSLTQGNIVSLGLELYRAKGNNNYFVTSLLAHVWLFLLLILVYIVLFVVFSFLFILILQIAGTNPWGAIFGMAGIGVLGYLCTPFIMSRFVAAGGLMARQMFWALRGEKEDLEAARAAVFPRFLDYGVAGFWVALLLLFLLVLLTPFCIIGFRVWYEILWAYADSILLTSQFGWTIRLVTILGLLLAILAVLLVIAYFMMRLSFTDVILAIEPAVTPWQSVVRSWQITRHQGLHSLIVLFIGSIVIFAGNLLTQALTFVVTPIVSWFYGVVTFPFWQGAKTGLYYDLRCRNEGLNFDLDNTAASPRKFLRRVIIQTPESIELDFTLAGVGSRSFAWLIDNVIVWTSVVLLAIAGLLIYAYVIFPFLQDNFSVAQKGTIDQWLLAFFALFMFILINGYFIIFETVWQGQTPGKRFAEIRVVRDNGQPVRLPEAALRSLINVVDFNLFFIGLILIVFNKSEKRLGDLAAGTLVVQDEALAVAPRTRTVRVSDISAATRAFAYRLLEGDTLKGISADQYLKLRNFIRQRDQFTPRERIQTATKLAEQLRPVVLPTELMRPPDLTEEEFLLAVYLAYRRYHRSAQTSNEEMEFELE